MAYQVLARKWRPQDFSEVVGQESIVTALRNALTEGRIAQAYLFSGIRGVGKTSVARILAKALNCERGPTADPCNECVACTEITASSGTNLDVHEIDAATHSKVEQVRDLTEGLKYGPARDRYKVVIIDEIHRLSRQAFDALLKIVEEPPPHLVFIFATTEAEAVSVTILSRCQEFRFRRVPSKALAGYLKKISDAEKIEVGDTALRLLARAGDGSVRDAVALLDQLATFGSGRITDEEATRLLGGVDHAVYHRLLSAIVGGDSAEVSAVVREVEGQGWDPRHVYGEFLNYARDALHLALGGAGAEIDLPKEEADRLTRTAKAAGYENLLRLLHQLLASENTVRRSEMGSLALEICWLRAAELPKLVRVEEILGGVAPDSGGGGSAPRKNEPEPPAEPEGPEEGRLFDARARAPRRAEPEAGRAGVTDRASADAPPSAPSERSREEAATTESRPAAKGGAPPPEPPEPSASEPPEPSRPPEPPAPERAEVAPAAAEPPAPSESPVPGSEAAAPTPDDGAASDTAGEETPGVETAALQNGQIGRFLEEVSRRKLPLAAHLREASRIVFEDRVLMIHCAPGDAWLNTAALSRPSNRRALEGALEATFGEDARWKVVECDEPPTSETLPPETGPSAVERDPRVQKVLDIFGGHVETVDDP